MKFTYFEPIEKSLEIDFDVLYKEVLKNTSEDSIYEEFCDNIDFYLKELYNIEIDSECNLLFYDEVASAWEEYLDNKQ